MPAYPHVHLMSKESADMVSDVSLNETAMWRLHMSLLEQDDQEKLQYRTTTHLDLRPGQGSFFREIQLSVHHYYFGQAITEGSEMPNEVGERHLFADNRFLINM
jgi:hypothetical protein